MQFESTEWETLIVEGAKALGIHLDYKIAHQFAIHGSELVKWTKKINLTAITDPFEVGLKHFLDSIAPAHFIPPTASLLDIGSGGGFPGIPLKILMPSLSVVLIDGSRKKVSFLRHIIRLLQLENIEARQVRAEEFSKTPGYANAFDVVISRALSALGPFVKMADPLLTEAGILITYKGKLDQKELDALRSHVPEKIDRINSNDRRYFLTVEKYQLPVFKSERSILIIRHFRQRH
jgi:16S rRNA (guanine527-N7)-methyltransferase